jgi:hypothetical protein
MSACPQPDVTTITNFSGGLVAKVINPPAESDEGCGAAAQEITVSGSGTPVSTTVSVPGPTGLKGDKGDQGDPGLDGACGLGFKDEGAWALSNSYKTQNVGTECNSSVVTHNDVAYTCTTDHTSAAETEPGVGAQWNTVWAIFVSGSGVDTSAMRWKGVWADATAYVINDLVMQESSGNAYICAVNHTSTVDDEPYSTTGGDFYWEAVTNIGVGTAKALDQPEEGSWWDQLKNGVTDWIDDATVGDWLTVGATAAGIIYAGSEISDMMDYDGVGDGEANSVMTGPEGIDTSTLVEIDENTTIHESETQPANPEVDDIWFNPSNDEWKQWNGSSWVAINAPANLRYTVRNICDRAGLSLYDVSELPLRSCNLTVASISAARDLLEQLSLAYQFDIIDSAGVLKFKPRSADVVRTITLNDLGYSASSDIPAPYVSKRFQGIDLPRSLTLSYVSRAMDFGRFTQVSNLVTFDEGQDVKIDVPITMTEAEAKLITDSTLVNAHMERMTYAFSTSYDHIDLEPGDVIDSPMGTLRIMSMEEEEEGVLNFTATDAGFNALPQPIYDGETIIGYTASTFIGTGQAPAEPKYNPKVAVEIGYSQGLFLELPTLHGADTGLRGHVAIHGYGAAGWPGATLYKSVDGGQSFKPFATAQQESSIGIVATAISAPPDYTVWDNTTTITVVLKTGSLQSKPELAVLNGENRCMIGPELISFKTATLVDTNTYELSGLLRGRQGTEQRCDEHVNNELFVLLDDAIVEIPIEPAERAVSMQYKVVTKGSDTSKAQAQTVQIMSGNLKPWAVAHAKATKIANDFKIEWIERPRFNNSLQDFNELSHDFDWQGYTVTILDPIDDSVVRTQIVQTPYWTYSEADQILDFGSARSSIKCKVYAMSTKTGGGDPVTINS